MTSEHRYQTRLIWDGNRGGGTSSYQQYGRDYRVQIAGKPDLAGSADPVFLGDADRYNPEELFVAAISACHMLAYLALCARHRISVLGYEDSALGTLRLDGSGGGSFDEVVLRPAVTLAPGSDLDRALELHAEAHRRCFIASSCRTPIGHQPTVRVAREAL